MVAYSLCAGCRGDFGLLGKGEPVHCYGAADRPAPPGVFGPCRDEVDE